MEPELDLKSLLEQNSPLLFVDSFLEQLMKKITFSDFVQHLVFYPGIYGIIRQKQDLWYEYSLQHLSIYIPVDKSEIIWFDFIQQNSTRIYLCPIAMDNDQFMIDQDILQHYHEANIVPVNNSHYKNVISPSFKECSNNPWNIPYYVFSFLNDRENTSEIKFENITKYGNFSNIHIDAVPHNYFLILCAGKLYMIEFEQTHFIRIKLLLSNIVDFIRDSHYNTYAISTDNTIYFVSERLISEEKMEDYIFPIVIEEIKSLHIRQFLPIWHAFLFVTTDGKLYVKSLKILLYDHLIGPESFKYNLYHFLHLEEIEKKLGFIASVSFTSCFDFDVDGGKDTFAVLKIRNNGNMMLAFDLNDVDFLKMGHLQRLNNLDNYVQLIFQDDDNIVQFLFLNEYTMLFLDEHGNIYYRYFFLKDVQNLQRIQEFLNMCKPIKFLDGKITDINSIYDENGDTNIRYIVQSKILVPRVVHRAQSEHVNFSWLRPQGIVYCLDNSPYTYLSMKRN